MNEEKMREVVAFLLGEGELDGLSFGDSNTDKPRPRYWWRNHLRAALKSENSSAKQKYDELMKDCEETSPIERLRFYCSLAMSGQDWLDAEPFINALQESEAGAVREWIDVLVEAIDAIDCRYRGDPTYDHDAYYMKDRVKKLIADHIKYLPTSTVTPPSTQAIETATYMRAAEVCDDHMDYALSVKNGADLVDSIRLRLRALIPQDGRTALEEFGVRLVNEVADHYGYSLLTDAAIRTIVNQVMKEVGK